MRTETYVLRSLAQSAQFIPFQVKTRQAFDQACLHTCKNVLFKVQIGSWNTFTFHLKDLVGSVVILLENCSDTISNQSVSLRRSGHANELYRIESLRD